MTVWISPMQHRFGIISWDDNTESALSCAEDLHEEDRDQALDLALDLDLDGAHSQGQDQDQADAVNDNNDPSDFGYILDQLPRELKLAIWKEALIAGEKSLQYELLFRLPHHGGATARVISGFQGWNGHGHGNHRHHHEMRGREQRVREFGMLSREARTAVRDTYVWLPQHRYFLGEGGLSVVAPRQLASTEGSWACPAIDRFSWAAMLPMPVSYVMVTRSMAVAVTVAGPNDTSYHHNPTHNESINDYGCLYQPQPQPQTQPQTQSHPWPLVKPWLLSPSCGGTYHRPSMLEFLACSLEMPTTPKHPMYPWPGCMDLYAKFCAESTRLLDAVQHLDLALSALLLLVQSSSKSGPGKSGQAAVRDLGAFPRLQSIAISVTISTPKPTCMGRPPVAAAAPAAPATAAPRTVLGAMDSGVRQKYIAENDPWVKVSLGLVLSRRYGAEIQIPEAWGCLAEVPPCAGFHVIYSHVLLSVVNAERMYGVGKEGWKGFLEFYRSLVQHGVDVSIVSGHSTQWVKPLSY